MVASALTQQECLQPMLGLATEADRVFARADELAEGLIVGDRNADRGEFAGAMQPGQRVPIAPQVTSDADQ